MSTKAGRYALVAVLWCVVGAYVLFSAGRVRSRRAAQRIERVEIEILDSTAHGQLVTRRMVDGWLREGGLKTVGAPMDEVDLEGLERLIARNGFVERVRAGITYSGVLRIDVSQRRPLLRLLVDGYDAYVTEEGFVFAAPRSSSHYVPVVTGSYRPPFTPSWTGPLRESLAADKAASEERIREIETEKYPFFRREAQNDENLRELRRRRIRKGIFESQESFERRVAELREEKARLRRRYRYEAQVVQQAIERIGQRQEAERRRQKKSEKKYEDFAKLITFVQQIGQDDFWNSEIVQIVASTAPSGSLEIEIVPRSGSYTVLLGRLEHLDEKLAKLRSFYRNGLANIGWESYRIIDLKYEGQVVCTK